MQTQAFDYRNHGPAEVRFRLGDITSADTLCGLWPDGPQTVEISLELEQLNQRRIVRLERPTSIASQANLTPTFFRLGVGYPNPFNAGVVFPVDVPRESVVLLEVYNIVGQKVRTLVNKVLTAGTHRILWEARDTYSQPVGTGMYVLRGCRRGSSSRHSASCY